MKKEISLSQLFEIAKKGTQGIQLSDVKSLVGSGKTSPLAAKRSFRPRRITTRLFNPFKFLVMITSVIIITSALMIWGPVSSKDTDPGQSSQEGIVEIESPSDVSPRPSSPEVLQKSEDPGVSKVPVQKPLAPARMDTVFKGEILELSKEEFTRLGFMFDDEGFYYLNRMPNGKMIDLWSWKREKRSSAGFHWVESANERNKQKVTSLDFYPLLSTDVYGGSLFMPNLRRTFVADSFNIMNDTLVPVLFKSSTFGGKFTNGLILWFQPSDAFFSLVQTDQGNRAKKRIAAVREIALSSSALKDLVKYEFPEAPAKAERKVSTLKTIKLSPEVFKCMGFNLASDTVEYPFKVGERWLTLSVFGKGNRIKIVMAMDSILANQERVELYFIARFMDDGSSQPIGSAFGHREAYQEELEFCVPVQLDNPALPPFVRDAIFWINPTQQFFNCLPPEIARPMLMEFNYQKKRIDPDFVPSMGLPDSAPGKKLKQDAGGNEDEPVPCVYFTNLCESLPGLDYVNLYPNPVTDKLTVDLVLLTAKKIRFRVFDMGGRVITDDGLVRDFPEGGQVTHQMDVSKLRGGLYLLVMEDEVGARLTRRFIKN